VQYVSEVVTAYLATSAVTEQYYSFRIFFIYQVANELIKFQCVLAKYKMQSIYTINQETRNGDKERKKIIQKFLSHTTKLVIYIRNTSKSARALHQKKQIRLSLGALMRVPVGLRTRGIGRWLVVAD
jgi:hypothetical protein